MIKKPSTNLKFGVKTTIEKEDKGKPDEKNQAVDAMLNVSKAEKLSQREVEKLNKIRKEVLNEYRQKALEMFDDDKNQSLMLS